MIKDPGFVAQESFYSNELDESSIHGVQTHDEGSLLQMGVRYRKSCKKHIYGFDHHCPAFGNCMIPKSIFSSQVVDDGFISSCRSESYYVRFVILVGFITTETLYIVCSSQYIYKLDDTEIVNQLAVSYDLQEDTVVLLDMQLLLQLFDSLML
ncbi:hypothetical protein DITRI_Ditri02bG0158000 [Diplodiscus trichospermus]